MTVDNSNVTRDKEIKEVALQRSLVLLETNNKRFLVNVKHFMGISQTFTININIILHDSKLIKHAASRAEIIKECLDTLEYSNQCILEITENFKPILEEQKQTFFLLKPFRKKKNDNQVENYLMRSLEHLKDLIDLVEIVKKTINTAVDTSHLNQNNGVKGIYIEIKHEILENNDKRFLESLGILKLLIEKQRRELLRL